MRAAIDKIDGIKDNAATELAIHRRSAVKVFIPEPGILVGIAARAKTKRADYRRVCILGDNRYAKTRILLDAVKGEIFLVQAYGEFRILAGDLKTSVDYTACGLVVGISADNIKPVGNAVKRVISHFRC